MTARIRKGDKVQVMTGRDKGKRGEVLQVLPKDDRAVVQGVNMVKRHLKPKGMGQPGGIQEREGTIHLSNLMPIDPKTDKPTRVSHKFLGDGKKVRVAQASGEVLDA